MSGPMHRPEFREQGMTYVEFVRDVLGDDTLTDAECDAILWELTPFPLAQGRDDLRPYLVEVREGRRTFESVYAEMDAALAAAHPEDDEREADARRRGPKTPAAPPGVVDAEVRGDLL